MKYIHVYTFILTLLTAHIDLLYSAADNSSIESMHIDLTNYFKARYPSEGNASAALRSLYSVINDERYEPKIRANARLNAGWIHYYDRHKGIQNRKQALELFNDVLNDQFARPEDRAQARLVAGKIYALGAADVPQDGLRALDLFNAIAQDASVSPLIRAKARQSAGLIYYEGYIDDPQRYARALEFFNDVMQDQAAPKADRAQARLYASKIYYVGGHGVRKNYLVALNLSREVMNETAASDEKHIEAQLGVGIISFGIGMVIEDEVPAEQRDETLVQRWYDASYANIIDVLKNPAASHAQRAKAYEARQFLENDLHYQRPAVLASHLSTPEVDLFVMPSVSASRHDIPWDQPAASLRDDQAHDAPLAMTSSSSSSSSSSSAAESGHSERPKRSIVTEQQRESKRARK